MIRNVNKEHREHLSILDRMAVKITSFVGTVYCAILFGLLALMGLPEALNGGKAALIGWLTQTFLQLVLLSIIMAGQNIQSRYSERRADADYETNIEAKKDIEEVNRKLDLIVERLK